jgi:NADH-quinone oxidoreductase subunit L
VAAWLIALTIGLPWLGAAAVWLLSSNPKSKIQNAKWVHPLAALFALASAVASLALLSLASSELALRLPLGGTFGDVTFIADGLAVFLAAVATVIGSLAVIFSADYLRGDPELGRYYALVLLFIGAMAGLVLSSSLLFVFFFWEITAFCSYALIAFHNDDPKAVRGGIKALIMTQVGGAGLLLGALVIQAYQGNTDIPTFLAAYQTLPPAALNLIAFAFLAAAAAKSAQVPFHTWLPDAMEAPTPVSALIHAATMVNAGVYLLARFYPAFAAVPGWQTAVIIVGLLSALLAGLMALVAADLKRALAYSTVSQLGYMVYAIGVGAIFAAQFHLLSHAVFKALLFLAAGAVIHATGTREMAKMGGLRRPLPFVAAVFSLGAAALAGIPILNGFWSKELLLEAGLHDGPGWAYLGMLFGAGLTAAYSLRATWLVFAGPPAAGQTVHAGVPGRWMRLALWPLAIGTLTTWLLAGPFGALLAETLPFHHLATPGRTLDLVTEVIFATPTLIALVVVALGLAAWWWRGRFTPVTTRLADFGRLVTNGFGFDWLNDQFVATTQATAAALQRTQTGQLNWNVAGIVTALILVAIFLLWSG